MLKWGRERARIRPERLAEMLHASTQEVERWESNQSRPTLKKAMDFARAVHMPFGYLYLSSRPNETLPFPMSGVAGNIPPSPQA